MGRTSKNSPSLDNLASKTDQTIFEVSLYSVGQIFGVGGDSLSRISDFTCNLNPKALQVTHVLHFTDTSTGGKQSLGRNASSVYTSATNVASSKDGSGKTLGSAVQSSTVSSNTTSNDSNIEVKVAGTISHGQGGKAPQLMSRREGRNSSYYESQGKDSHVGNCLEREDER